MRIAIIGAGLAGLSCAQALGRDGHAPALFEKSRGVGGRLSTRRASVDGTEINFDHGAQYMTTRDPLFRDTVQRWAAAGIAAPWPDAGEDAWVGVPGMNTPARRMADGLDMRREQLVTGLDRTADGWRVLVADKAAAEPFDAAVVALPAEQAATLLAPIAPTWSALAADTRSEPCWTVMAAFPARLPVAADVISRQAPIGWAARNSAKPGRGGPEAWVIQADPAWSAAELERTADEAGERLLAAFADLVGLTLPAPTHLSAHRWRYARSGSAKRTALWNPETRLGVCGDWLIGPRVESAFSSGAALAGMIGNTR